MKDAERGAGSLPRCAKGEVGSVELPSRLRRWEIRCGFALGWAASLAMLALVAGYGPAPLGADEFEERPEILRPKTPRGEAAADRAHAAALYAHGRLLLQRDREDDALRRFQRAWRYDPQPSVAREIVRLAMESGRNDEAVRYAALNADDDGADPADSLRLAALASENRDWRRAAALYGQAARIHRAAGERDFTIVLLHLELGRLEFLLERAGPAAEALEVVREAIEQPEKYGLNDALQKLLLERPEQTYALMAEAFLDAGRLDAAAAMFAKLRETQKNDALHAFRLARLDVARKQYAAARRRLDECFAANLTSADRDPYDLLLECLRGESPEQADVDARAVELLTPWRDRFPDNRPLALFLAERLTRLGRSDDADRLYAAIVRDDSEAEEFAGWIETRRRGADDRRLLEVLARASTALGSLDDCEEAVARLAEDRDRVQRLAKLAAQVDGAAPEASRKEEAPRKEEAGANAGARIAGAAYAAAQVALAAREHASADELFDRAIGSGSPPKNTVAPYAALAMIAADQPARAAVRLRNLLDDKIRPESARAYYYHLIGALESAGKTDEALAAGREARNEGQASPLVESRIAWVAYHARRRAEAEEAYRRILADYDADRADLPSRAAVREARLVLSHLAVLRGDRAAAEERLEEVLDEHPDDVGARNDLAYLWSEGTRHLERALAMSRQVVAAAPRNDAYRDTLGWVLFRLGRHAEALGELERAAAGDEPDGVILDHLGDCLEKLGRRADAEGAWRRAIGALRADDDGERRRAIEAKLAKP